MSFGGLGKGLLGVVEITGGALPGAAFLGTAGALLTAIDPEEPALIKNPFPPNPYGRYGPLWGVPVLKADDEWELMAWTLDNSHGDLPPQWAFIMDEIVGQHSDRLGGPHLLEDTQVIRKQENVPHSRWVRASAVRVARAKNVFERDPVTGKGLVQALERVQSQVSAHNGPPEFRDPHRPTFNQWLYRYFVDHAELDGSGTILRVRHPWGAVSKPISSWTAWSAGIAANGPQGGYQQRWKVEDDEAALQYAQEAEHWAAWRLEVETERQKAAVVEKAKKAAEDLFESVVAGEVQPEELGLTLADLLGVGIQPAPAPVAQPSTGKVGAVTLAGAALALFLL